MVRKLSIAVLLTTIVAIAILAIFQRPIGERLFAQGAAARIGGAGVHLDDGLHLILCGTGSPLPNPDRAGPCNVVVAGNQTYVVDIGEGGARNLGLMQIDVAGIDGLLLTHFHSDHIDGMGPLALLYWTTGTATAPLPVHGPAGVEDVVDGFNAFYATDKTYRIAHHGEDIVPATGGGARAFPFKIGSDPVVILERGGLRITAFRVDHDPVRPAVGYRFDYRGRSIVISGDAAQSAELERVARGADILVHDALQPRLVGAMTDSFEANGDAHLAKISRDIQDYHASPEQAAESAQRAKVRQLVLSHLVPPLPSQFFYAAFVGEAADRYDGDIVVGEDGMIFSLPPDSDAIVTDDLL